MAGPKTFNPGDVLSASDVMKYLQNWWASTSLTTDSTGHNTITHGAGFTPSVVVACSGGPNGGTPTLAMVIVTSITATTFTVRCFDNSGNALNAQTVTVNWIALP